MDSIMGMDTIDSSTIKILKKTKKHTMINADGEYFELEEKCLEYGDYGFRKVWLTNLANILYAIGNNKTKVLAFLLENMNKYKNTIHITQQEIAKKSDVGFNVVNETIRILKKMNYIRSKGGVYIINPDVMYYGRYDQRARVRKEYAQYPKFEEKGKQVTLLEQPPIEEIKRVPIIVSTEEEREKLWYFLQKRERKERLMEKCRKKKVELEEIKY